jgi:hypothetical protein
MAKRLAVKRENEGVASAVGFAAFAVFEGLSVNGTLVGLWRLWLARTERQSGRAGERLICSSSIVEET